LQVASWIIYQGPIKVPEAKDSELPGVKNSEIKKLDSYVKKQEHQFWESFPVNHCLNVDSSVDIKKLESEIENAKDF
jgi:hypothetical protein